MSSGMTKIIDTALSALRTEAKRIEVSAGNIANLRSPGVREGTSTPGGFQPKFVVQSTRPGGGITSRVVPRDPASLLVYSPSSSEADADGLVAIPNINLEEEFITQIMARRAYEASAKLIKSEEERLRFLGDLLA